MEKLKDFLELEILNIGSYQLQPINILWVLLIFLFSWLILWVFKKYLRRKLNTGKLDEGKLYALKQIAAYIIYTVALMAAVDALGFKITVLLAGSTALLVGLGLGLQDLFRDMIAGFIILFERSVTAGDIVEITGKVGKVKEVGLRTTSLITREDIVLIVPNSKLTTDNVVNWSQNHRITRFEIDLRVHFGVDTALVRKILEDSVKDHPQVLKKPHPFVYFRNFGSSSLEFSLYFFSRNLFRIERTKSEIRFQIDQLFRAHKIQIPYPQRDLWVKQFPSESSKNEDRDN